MGQCLGNLHSQSHVVTPCRTLEVRRTRVEHQWHRSPEDALPHSMSQLARVSTTATHRLSSPTDALMSPRNSTWLSLFDRHCQAHILQLLSPSAVSERGQDVGLRLILGHTTTVPRLECATTLTPVGQPFLELFVKSLLWKTSNTLKQFHSSIAAWPSSPISRVKCYPRPLTS